VTKIAFGIALLLCVATSCWAVCLVPQPRLVCAEYFNSQVVVEATVLPRTRTVQDKDDPQGILAFIYTLRADRTFRGKITPTFRVYEANDSGRATFDWQPGRSYLLFLSYSKGDDGWVLDGCGNSGPLKDARAALDQIRIIKSDHDGGLIEGFVSTEALSDMLPGVRVEVVGAGHRYATTTDAKGEFRVKVSPGRYSVHASLAGHSFEPAALTHENPKDLMVESRGCAQVQLVEKTDDSKSH